MEDEEKLDGKLGAALQALPREREPGRLLEERTVHALRAAGVLGGGATGGGRRVIPHSWLAAGAAACLALFASGVAVGQWLGTRETARVLAAQQQSTLESMAALVERTGSAYVSALTQLAETHEAGSSTVPGAAQEAALQILHLAANEVVRMAPEDPVAVKILQGFDHAALEQASPPRSGERRRQIMWF